MDAGIFLDEFRPFRRGEIALARRAVSEPDFLPRRDLDGLRHVLRFAQLSSIGPEPDRLLDRVGNERLRLLQLLAPVLPVDPARIDPGALSRRLPKVRTLVEAGRRKLVEGGVASEAQLDAEIADKRLVVVLGGAAGSGYVFLGALQQLESLGITPSYLTGCSVGALLSVIRARSKHFDLEQLFDDIQRMRQAAIFRPARTNARFGVPAAVRLDLRAGLGELFVGTDGDQQRLSDLAIPVDALATGLVPSAFSESRESYAHMIDAELHSASALEKLPPAPLARWVSALVSLAMSRQVLVPIFLGATPETRRLAALDAAGFSAAIPALLQYDLPETAVEGAEVLESVFAQHGLAGLVDGALTSLIPARYTWDAIEAGRLGHRNCLILALDAVAKPRGSNALLAPILRVISATADRDKAFWDLHVNFRHAPGFLNLFPTGGQLRVAADSGEKQFAPCASLLQELLAPVPAWSVLHEPAAAR
jgi:hypothetical protein